MTIVNKRGLLIMAQGNLTKYPNGGLVIVGTLLVSFIVLVVIFSEWVSHFAFGKPLKSFFIVPSLIVPPLIILIAGLFLRRPE